MALGNRALASKPITTLLVVILLAAGAGYWYITRAPPEAPPGLYSEEVLDLNGAWRFKADFKNKGEDADRISSWNLVPYPVFNQNQGDYRIWSPPTTSPV